MERLDTVERLDADWLDWLWASVVVVAIEGWIWIGTACAMTAKEPRAPLFVIAVYIIFAAVVILMIRKIDRLKDCFVTTILVSMLLTALLWVFIGIALWIPFRDKPIILPAGTAAMYQTETFP